LPLQFPQSAENLVYIAYGKGLASDHDTGQTVFLKEGRSVGKAEKGDPMATLLKVQRQRAGGIHVSLCMDGKKSDVRHWVDGWLPALTKGRQFPGGPFYSGFLGILLQRFVCSIYLFSQDTWVFQSTYAP
jgi:hypothetical protein